MNALHGHGGGTKPVLLLTDSPRKEDGRRVPWTTSDDRDWNNDDDETRQAVGPRTQIQKVSLVGGAAASDMMRMATQPPESLGRLLVEMTAQVQDERSRRSDVEEKNQSLILEIEQLQREILELKTSQEQQTRRRASGDWDNVTRADHVPREEGDVPREANAELWWRELQDAKRAKDAAFADAHRRALEVMELQACISMQHDELKALRATEADVRFALTQAEDRSQELLAQHAILVQENQLLKDDVAHLNTEIGKRGTHFKALMDKWSESQAQCEHVERENRAMLDKMKELRGTHEKLQRETEQARDECEVLQHQNNHLKGAVAAKAAEARAFQAYGSNARDHLQTQQHMIQRHAIYRRKVHHVARDSAVLVHAIKTALASVRAPLVAIQHDFKTFLKNLKTPVLSLVARSRKYAEVAQIEHRPLRAALAHAEMARRHLHEQLWRARRNALLVCQIRNISSTAEPIVGEAPVVLEGTVCKRTLRANYATSELLLRESERDSLTVHCDALFSDRARGTGCWNASESVAPLLQSVLDGFNACATTFDGLPPLKLPEPLVSGGGATAMGVPELVLSQLFAMLHHGGAHFHRVKLTISFLGVYNEAIYDLLGLDPHANASAGAIASMNKIVVLEVQNADEALLVLRGGGENVDAAHNHGLLDKWLTHKVITVCVAHENLLLSGAGPGPSTTKSKLQIVELATGPPMESQVTAPGDKSGWEDRGRVKAHVAMENGVQALLTTLADVRVAADVVSSSSGSSFVRYHSSKLTVLLQDTVKASAKFLVVAALPGAVAASSAVVGGASSSTPQLDARAAQATRWMGQIRNAVGTGAGSHTGSHGSSDRSVEGFINRFTSQQSQAETATSSMKIGSNSLAFSSSELVERPALTNDVDPRRWEKELDHMHRRYGDLNTFTTAFYQPSPPTATRRRSYREEMEDHGCSALSPRHPSATVVNAEQLTDVVLRPDELMVVDPTETVLQPPPAPVKAGGRTNSKTGSKAYRGLPGHRNGSKRTDKTRRRVTTQAIGTASSQEPSTLTTLAPVGQTTAPRATSMVKVRRETASSVLKKVLGISSAPKHNQRTHAASVAATRHHASSLTANRSAPSAPASASASASVIMTVATATQARLQNRKIPFK